MNRYNNVECPVCNKRFVDGDDVVVCPVCGAPHHRACYQIEGKCRFEDKHGEEFQWENPNDKREEKTQNGDPKKCPKCSATNPTDGIFCQVCGYPLRKPAPENEQKTYNPYGAPPIDITAFTTPYGGLDPEEEIDGVTAKELALFVGENSFYYVPRIKEMKKTGKKVSWNWSAFIFNFMYYFNRKMYVMGALMLALYIITMVPSIVFVYHVMARNVDLIAMGEMYMENFNTAGLEMLMYIVRIASFVYSGIAVVSGLFANRLYTNFVYKKIKEVREEMGAVDKNSAEYSNALAKTGRTNHRLAVGSMAGVMAGLSIVMMIIANIITQGI